MVKTCTKCNEEKPLEGFSKKTSAKDGLQSQCKACAVAQDKAYYEANKEKIYARNKARREANKEKEAARTKAWRESHPYEVLASSAKGRARRYNALPSWYSQTHHDQIIGILEERDRITEATGIQHEVDHILPLNGDTVSGFHIPENLQIITRTENKQKGNKYDFS